MSRFKGDRRHKSTASRTIIIGLTACGNTKWIPINWPAFFRIPRGTRSSRIEVEPPTTPSDGRNRVYPSELEISRGTRASPLLALRSQRARGWNCSNCRDSRGPILFIPPSGVRLQNSRESSLEYGRRLDSTHDNHICLWESWSGRGGRGGREDSLSPSGQCRFWAEFISRNGSLGTSSRYHGDVGSWIIG